MAQKSALAGRRCIERFIIKGARLDKLPRLKVGAGDTALMWSMRGQGVFNKNKSETGSRLVFWRTWKNAWSYRQTVIDLSADLRISLFAVSLSRLYARIYKAISR